MLNWRFAQARFPRSSSFIEVDVTFLGAGSNVALPPVISSKRHVVIEEEEVGEGQHLAPYSRLGWLAAVIDRLDPMTAPMGGLKVGLQRQKDDHSRSSKYTSQLS